VDVRKNLLRIRRAVTYTKETGRIVKPPKSEAGIRNVTIPPHLMPLVEAHLRDHVGADEDALLFGGNAVGGWLPESTWRDLWAKARLAAGRSDLKFHDLRHTSGTLAAQTGASLKELMVRMGHSTWAAALRYQHSATGRDQIIAAGLSEIAHAGSPDNVTLITEGGKKKKPAIRKKKTA
jgi:integrase